MNTIWLEFTRRCWPPSVDMTLFGPVLRLTWFGVGFSQHNLTDWVRSWRGILASALKTDSPKNSRQRH